jgi:hypothetical protein
VAWAGRSLTVFSTIARLRASAIGFLPGGLLRPLICRGRRGRDVVLGGPGPGPGGTNDPQDSLFGKNNSLFSARTGNSSQRFGFAVGIDDE